jgi:phage terminase large subunit-like protein
MALSICQKAAWLVEYLHELTVFPKGKHDDRVDSTARMVDWFMRAALEAAGLDVDTV